MSPLPGPPGPQKARSRIRSFAVYAVMTAMVVTVIFIGASAAQEIHELSNQTRSQSLWHVYQTHEGVQRVATTATEVAQGRANEDRLRIDLELLAAQADAVREFHIINNNTPPELVNAWQSVEHRIAEALATVDASGPLPAAKAAQLAETFNALTRTSRHLVVTSQQVMNLQANRFRVRMLERFWQAAGAMTLLLLGLGVLLWRARVGQRHETQLTQRLLELNHSLESRVQDRTHEIDADRRLRSTILEASPSAIALLRLADGEPLYFNARMRQALGLISTPSGPFPVSHLFVESSAAKELEAQLQSGTPVQDHEALIAGASPFHALVSARHVTVRDEPALLVWLHDHSQRKRLEQELQRLATTDALTLLANRRAFFEQGQQMIEHARRYGHGCSLLMIDIDHFKTVNDQHGHRVGDLLLRLLSDRLRDVLRQADLVARLGGEEFAALMPQTDLAAAAQAAERVREVCDGLRPEVPLNGDLLVSVSVGVSQLRSGESLEHLMERADAALYRAKRKGRNRVEAD